jgi:hypothetical protein
VKFAIAQVRQTVLGKQSLRYVYTRTSGMIEFCGNPICAMKFRTLKAADRFIATYLNDQYLYTVVPVPTR